MNVQPAAPIKQHLRMHSRDKDTATRDKDTVTRDKDTVTRDKDTVTRGQNTVNRDQRNRGKDTATSYKDTVTSDKDVITTRDKDTVPGLRTPLPETRTTCNDWALLLCRVLDHCLNDFFDHNMSNLLVSCKGKGKGNTYRHVHLKVHKREIFYGSDFEIFTFS